MRNYFWVSLLLCCASCQLLNAQDEAKPEHGEASTEVIGYDDAVILGAVEGVTEYLPISSTGHLILTNKALGISGDEENSTQKSAVDAYSIVIQGGAILAVIIIYWKDVLNVILGALGKSSEGFRLGLNLLLAFLPAAVLGLLLNDWIESKLFGHIPVAIALIAGAPLMLLTERWRRKKLQLISHNSSAGHVADNALMEKDLHEITPKEALFVGLMQSVAMCPGTSRSMMTITGGYMIGLSPEKSARFSFLLGLVTLSAATFYTLIKHGKKMAETLEIGPAMLGIVVATVTAAISVKWLVSYLSRHGLDLFAWYRILLAVVVLLIFGV